MSQSIAARRLHIEAAKASTASAPRSEPSRLGPSSYHLERAADGAVLDIETRNLSTALEGERYVLRIVSATATAWLTLNVTSPRVRDILDGAVPGLVTRLPARLSIRIPPGADGIDFSVAGLLDAIVAAVPFTA